MLFSGGRIMVAAAGAIVLVIVAIYAVRSVWWEPTASIGPISPTAESSLPPPGASATSGAEMPAGVPGGVPGGGTGPGAGESGGENTSEPNTSEKPADQTPFTATVEKVKRFLGTVFVDVELPKVSGGDPAVASVFNDEMDRALQAQADSVTAGTLQGRPDSGVRIGDRVLSGVLRTAAVDLTTASSTPMVSTVVADAQSGSIITLTSLFTDLDEGLAELVIEAETLGPSTSVGSDFDTTKLQPTEEMFGRWSAETAGMKVFFTEGVVAPESAGVVELVIPWDDLSDVMKPGVADIVTS